MTSKIKFYIDDMLSRGSNTLILWLGAISLVAVTAAATIVWIFQLGPQESFGGLFWDLMMRAVTPWEIEASMGSLPYLLVLLSITLFGIFVLSILISLLSAIIDARVQDVTRGSQPFPFDHHIVIVGWSPRLTAIIEELVIANESKKLLRILILSSKPSDELASLIDASFIDLKTTKLYFRSRDLCTESSFENANLRSARQILILGDTSEEIEGNRLKIYLSIRKYLSTNHISETQWPEIIVNVESADESNIINVSSASKAVTVNVSDIPARLIVETVIQPNLPDIYEEILSFDGNEIYITNTMAELGLGAMPFASAWSALNQSIPIGFWSDDNRLELAPRADAIVSASDRLIVISEDDSTIAAKAVSRTDHLAASNTAILKQLDANNTSAQRVLLIGMSTNHQFIFDRLVQTGIGVKQLTVCLPDNEVGMAMKRDLTRRKATKVKFIMAKTDVHADLARLKPNTYDAIIVSHTALPQTGGADIQTIKSIQILRSLLADKLTDVHLIAEMLEGKNRDILAYELDSDFVVSEKIGSKVFAQYIENPALRHVIDKLICSQSHHIKLYPIEVGKTSLAASFGDIGRGLLTRQKILIGWTYCSDGSRVSIINPDADSTLPDGYQRLNLMVIERK
jgi:ion channel POLLUX/CASTOR